MSRICETEAASVRSEISFLTRRMRSSDTVFRGGRLSSPALMAFSCSAKSRTYFLRLVNVFAPVEVVERAGQAAAWNVMERVLADQHAVHGAIAHFQHGVTPGGGHRGSRRADRLSGENGQAAAGAELGLVGLGFIFAAAETAAGAAAQLDATGGDAHSQTELHVAIVGIE